MIFYHVSTDVQKDGVFYPRYPESIMEGEFASIQRVCVAPTIDDCLSAIPNGGSRLDELNDRQQGFYKVFRIDTEKLGIPENEIITSTHLFENEMVPDAEWTEEHWILTDFTVSEEDTFMIHLNNWSEEPCDLIPKWIYDLADEEFEGDYTEAYMEEMDDMVPCMSAIKHIKYVIEPYKAGDTIIIPSYSIEDEDVERIIEVAKAVYGVTLEEGDSQELLVKEGELTIEELAFCSLVRNINILEPLVS